MHALESKEGSAHTTRHAERHCALSVHMTQGAQTCDDERRNADEIVSAADWATTGDHWKI
jgi:hypothetical protein